MQMQESSLSNSSDTKPKAHTEKHVQLQWKDSDNEGRLFLYKHNTNI